MQNYCSILGYIRMRNGKEHGNCYSMLNRRSRSFARNVRFCIAMNMFSLLKLLTRIAKRTAKLRGQAFYLIPELAWREDPYNELGYSDLSEPWLQLGVPGARTLEAAPLDLYVLSSRRTQVAVDSWYRCESGLWSFQIVEREPLSTPYLAPPHSATVDETCVRPRCWAQTDTHEVRVRWTERSLCPSQMLKLKLHEAKSQSDRPWS